MTVMNQIRSKEPNAESQMASAQAENMGESLRQNAEAVQGLGMRRMGLSRWSGLRNKALGKQIEASDKSAGFTAGGKALRFYLQSFMLAAGAWLVLDQQISPGMMIAGSILLGRALAPIEQAIGQWALFQRAMRGWSALSEVLEKTPEEPQKTELPAPKGVVEAKQVSVLAPGEQVPALRNISFKIEPGQALGVIGPSGAGKTTLAKVLTGIWPPAAGKVRIDGAALDQWPSDRLGRFVGYLPQEIGLLAGSVADNIARLDPQPDPKEIVLSAQRAGAHELLLSLPQGYDTDIGAGGQRLSGGQRQRVALARALYGDPPVLILDEPNANLDAPGEQALVDAIRDAKSRGRTVIIMAHRPSAIAACDYLLMIDKGVQVDFGPRDEVLKKRTRNYPQLTAKQPGRRRSRSSRQRGCTGRTGCTAPGRSTAAKGSPHPAATDAGPDIDDRCIVQGRSEMTQLQLQGPAGGGEKSSDGWSAKGYIRFGLICVLVLGGGFGGWAATANLAGAVIAMGQLRSEANRQVVQHPDGGVVSEILARDGDTVEAGDVLIKLDDTRLRSDLAAMESQYFEILARLARLEAVQIGANKIDFDPELLEAAQSNPEVQRLIDGQVSLFIARRASMGKERDILEQRKIQLSEQIVGTEAQVTATQKSRELIAKELADMQKLLRQGLARADRVLALQREEARLEGESGQLIQQVAQLKSQISETEIELLRMSDTEREEAIAQSRELGFRRIEIGENRASLIEQLSRLDIRAPRAGTVLESTVFALKSVIRPAEPILYIAPSDTGMVVDARVETINRDQVWLGQDTVLRFSAFNARTTPEIFGVVRVIAEDATTDEQMGISYYTTEVRINEGELAKLDGQELVAGMPVEVYIQTGKRTPIEYLMKPIADYFTTAWREE